LFCIKTGIKSHAGTEQPAQTSRDVPQHINRTVITNEAILLTISVIASTSRDVPRPACKEAISFTIPVIANELASEAIPSSCPIPAKDYFSRSVGIVMTHFDTLRHISTMLNTSCSVQELNNNFDRLDRNQNKRSAFIGMTHPDASGLVQVMIFKRLVFFVFSIILDYILMFSIREQKFSKEDLT